jgi:hypothetical protein
MGALDALVAVLALTEFPGLLDSMQCGLSATDAEACLTGGGLKVMSLRMLRLTRLFRLGKLFKRFPGLQLLLLGLLEIAGSVASNLLMVVIACSFFAIVGVGTAGGALALRDLSSPSTLARIAPPALLPIFSHAPTDAKEAGIGCQKVRTARVSPGSAAPES